MAATAEAMPCADLSRNNTPHHMIADFKHNDNDYEDFAIEDEEDLEPMTLELKDDNDTEEAHHKNQASAQVGLEDLAGSFSIMADSNISSNTKK